MRITIPEALHPDFSDDLSQALDTTLIRAKVSYDPATGLPSDDHAINSIIEDITGQSSASVTAEGFILCNYPQNIIQAQALDMALARIGQPVSCALMVESTKKPQNRENRALIRYYRTQNKLVLIDETDNISQLCRNIRRVYEKRRSSDSQNEH
ncbi:MAG: hypothetical protein U9N50_01025 [Pseudomonadota bacterium]|nr:hypothetical protein [Pseudomonadota bacterium]